MLLTHRWVKSSVVAGWRWSCASRLTRVPQILGHIDGVRSGVRNYPKAVRRHLQLQDSMFGKSGKGLVSIMSAWSEAENARSHVLDIGSGLRGPARTVAETYGCHVTGIDTLQPVELSNWL